MKKRNLIIALCFILVLAAVFMIWHGSRPEAAVGEKAIILEVIHSDGTHKDFQIHTDAENLRGALEEVDQLIGGEESAYGLMVYTVDGETADWNRDQSWWCLTKSGEWMDTGVDDTVIADGEHYEFTYTIG